MKLNCISFKADTQSSIDVPDELFVQVPRADLIHRVVLWQLARRQAGTHKTKTRSETSYSTKKIVRQKGSGGARHGSRGVSQFRHGGTTKGPVVRSHAHKLNKKIRKIGLVHAISSKLPTLKVVVDFPNKIDKTSEVADFVSRQKLSKTLILTSRSLHDGLKKSVSNLTNVLLMPIEGMNVYDIINSNDILVSNCALEELKERLL